MLICFFSRVKSALILIFSLILSNRMIKLTRIGEILFGSLTVYKMKKVLMNGKIETIQLAANGVSLIALPNGNLVYGTY